MTQSKGGDNLEHLIKLVAKSGIIIFVGSLIGKILRFLFYIIIIRALGAALYGLYSLGQSIIDIVTNVALLGDGKGAIRFGVEFLGNKDLARVKGIILSYLIFCCLLSSFIALLIFVFSVYISKHFFHEEALSGVLKMFAIAFPFYIFALASMPIGYIFHKFQYKVIIQEIFQPLFSIVAVVIMFLLGWRLYGAVGAFVISSLGSALLGFYLIKKAFPGLMSKTPCIFETRRLVVYSAPLILILFSYYFIFRIDRIILGIYRGAYEVGIYSAVSNTAIMILAFSSIFEAGFAPIVAQLSSSEDKQGLKRIYGLVTIWGASLIFAPTLCLIIFNSEFLSLFGVEFKTAGWILIVLTLAFFVEIMPGQMKQLFQMSSRQNMELVNSLGMIVANILLNLALIPHFGMMGAAFAMFFTYVFISIVRLVETKRFYNFSPFTLRYMKLLSFMFCSFIIALKYILKMDLTFRMLLTAIIISGFSFLSYKLKSSEDLLIWNAIKKKFYAA